MTSPILVLEDGERVPQVAYGFGALPIKDPEFSQQVAEEALEVIRSGYRHLDNAPLYNTQKEVGWALETSKIPREEFFITSKITPHMGLLDIEGSLRATLADLRITHLDCFLIHYPFIDKSAHGMDLEETWIEMERLRTLGLTRHIGLSNFRPRDLKRILSIAKTPPLLNQIELNPSCFEVDTVEFHRKHNILTQAYGPLTPLTSRDPSNPLPPLLADIAGRLGVTPAQVLLRWYVQEGFLIVTRSTNIERQKVQLDLESFSLTPADVRSIMELGATHKYRNWSWGVAGRTEYGDEHET